MNCIFLRRGYGSGNGGGSGGGSLSYRDNFADNDWATIAKVCAEGLVPATWKVGDQKAMSIGGTSYLIDIIGIQHDDFSDGGKAPFTFQLHDCYNTTYGMNSSDTNSGGWRDSQMRGSTLTTILSNMPAEVQSGITNVNKSTAMTSGNTTQTTTSDTLFLLSEWEALGVTNWSGVQEGTRYAYYANGGATIKNVNGTASQWWLRSVRSGGSSNQFAGVNATGTTTSIRASRTMGVSPAFCLGAGSSGGSGGGGGNQPTTKEYTVNITGTGSSTYCYVTINGTKYTSAKTLTVPEGTKISCTVSVAVGGYDGNAYVTLNGTKVLSQKGTYQYTVTSNCTIQLNYNGTLTIGNIAITTS